MAQNSNSEQEPIVYDGDELASARYHYLAESVGESGFYFEPYGAYDAYAATNKLTSLLNDLSELLALSAEHACTMNGGSYYWDIKSCYDNITDFYEYVEPFVVRFYSFLQSMMSLNSTYELTFNFIALSEGELDPSMLEGTKTEVTERFYEYYTIKTWCDASGKNYDNCYTLEDLQKNASSRDYGLFMSFNEVQLYGSAVYGVKYGEYGMSFSEGENGEVIKNGQPYLNFDNFKRRNNAEYQNFSNNNASVVLFSYENGYGLKYVTLNDLANNMQVQTEFIEWQQVRGLNSKYGNFNTMRDIDIGINSMRENLNNVRASLDIGTATIMFIEKVSDKFTVVTEGVYHSAGMQFYTYNKVTDFDSVASSIVLTYSYRDRNGDVRYASNEKDIPNDASDVNAVYYSDFSDTTMYKNVRKAFEENPTYYTSFAASDLGKNAYYLADQHSKEISNLEQQYNALINEKEKIKLSSEEYVTNVFQFQVNADYSINLYEDNFAISSIHSMKDKNAAYIDSNTNSGELNMESFRCRATDEECMYIIYSLIMGENEFFYQGDSIYYYDPLGYPVYIDGNDVLNNFVLWTQTDMNGKCFMTDAEKQAFLYNWNKGNGENYLELISDSLNDRYVYDRYQRDEKYAEEHPYLASLYSVVVTPFEGISALDYSIESLMNGTKMYSSHTYSSGTSMRSAVAQDIAESSETWGPTLSFLYSTGMSMADTALFIGVDTLTLGTMTPFLSVTMMGSRSYVGTLNDALDRGLSDWQAVGLAFASCAAESLMESSALDKLKNLDNVMNPALKGVLDQIDDPIAHSIVHIMGNAFIQGSNEGLEEFYTEVFNFFADQIISGDLSSFKLSMQEKINAGYSEEEAFSMTMQEQREQMALAFLGGFISGNVMGGGQTAISSIHNEIDIHKISADIMKEYNDSTFNYDIKAVRIDLRHGNFNSAMEHIMNASNTDFSSRLLAANSLLDSLTENNNINLEQKLELQSLLKNNAQQFSDLSVDEQIKQFNNLKSDYKAKFLNSLGANCITLFINLNGDTQKSLFKQLNIDTQLEILSAVNIETQNLLLGGQSFQNFVLANSTKIINYQINLINTSIDVDLLNIYKLLSSNNVNLNKFDSVINKILKEPSKISLLIDNYSNKLNGADLDTFNRLVDSLSIDLKSINDLNNIGNTTHDAMTNDSRFSNMNFDQVFASFIVSDDIRNSLIDSMNIKGNMSDTSKVEGLIPPNKFSTVLDIAKYFGDSNLFLFGIVHEAFKNKKVSVDEFNELKRGLYLGDLNAISRAVTFLDSVQLSQYNQLISDSNNSLQNEWISKLTRSEKVELRDYAENFGSTEAEDAMDWYGYDSKGNQYVTLPELMRAGVSDGSSGLDSAIEKFGVLPTEIVTYRGVGIDALTSQFGEIDVDNLDVLIGKVYSDKAYMSTTLLESKAKAAVGKPTDAILKITVPTDANYGAYIESQSNLNYKQLEFLIKKNSTSIIENAYVDERGKIVVEMKLFDDSVKLSDDRNIIGSTIEDLTVVESDYEDSSWVEDEDFEIYDDSYVLKEGESLRGKIGIQFFGGKVNIDKEKETKYFYSALDTANMMSEYGEFYTFEVSDFDNIPSDLWGKIKEPSLAYFRIKGKVYSFDEAKRMSELTLSSISSSIDSDYDIVNFNSDKFFNNLVLSLGNNNARKSLWYYVTSGNMNYIPSEFRQQLQLISSDDINTFLESYKTKHSINDYISEIQASIDVVDSHLGKNVGISQLYDYIKNGNYGNSKMLSTIGNFRNIVSKIDYNTLVQCYNRIVDSLNETKTIKDEIFENMPEGLDGLSKVRYLYLELNKRVSYDYGYFSFAKQSEEQQVYYSQDVTFDNLKDNKVICKGWSQLFRELLLSAGFSSDIVKIRGNNISGSHKWVEVDFGNYIIRADATDGFNHTIDLSASKSGSSTNGFIAIPRNLSGVNISTKRKFKVNKDGKDFYEERSIYDGLVIDDTWLRKIDENLGYAKGGKYFNEIVNDLANDFYSPNTVEETFYQCNENSHNAKYDYFMNLLIPDTMNSYDAFAYLSQVKHILFGKTNKIQIKRYFKPISDSSVPLGVAAVLMYNDDGTLNCKIIDDQSGIIEIKFNNISEYSNYIKERGYFSGNK